MGIYVKKKKFNILNFFLIFLFLIIVLTTLYFFKILSEKSNFDLSNSAIHSLMKSQIKLPNQILALI